MTAKVTLEVLEGPMRGKTFPFKEHDTFLFGRVDECQAYLPDDPKVSRHHFILEVNPPDASVRDLGSMNGTYVNDVKHGGREEWESPEQGAQRQYPDVGLKDGDRIKAGDTVFGVRVHAPAFCRECGKEISESEREQSRLPGGEHLCSACKAKAAPATIRDIKVPSPTKPEAVRCKQCGRDVSNEVGPFRRGNYICSVCRREPLELIRRMLERARGGERGLVAIRGYTTLKELGIGGMGAVYLARRDRTGEQLALKVMLPAVAANERARKMFLREVDVTKQLKHPRVVKSLDAGCSDGAFFMTLEFCDGGSVHNLVRKSGGRIPQKEAKRIIIEALDGLDYIHNAFVCSELADGRRVNVKGVVHRDVSPQNILLSGPTKVAKISDCGLAKAFETAGLSRIGTRTGSAEGKMSFMPRQQVINYKYAKPEVDVWAAAACLYNMLTGSFPRDFPRGRDPVQIILSTPAVPIRKRNSSVSVSLAKVIDHALQDKPEIGFKSAAELKQALEVAM